MDINIGRSIVAAQKKFKISNREVADYLGESRQNFNDIKKRKDIKLSQAISLVKFFGVPLHEFIELGNDKNPTTKLSDS